jgi:hypothetical protein
VSATSTLSVSSWRKKQVGDVGARNEQHERDRRHHEKHHRAEIPRRILANRLHFRAPAGVRVRILCGQPRGDSLQIASALLYRRPRVEPAHDTPRVIPAVLERIHTHRRPRAGCVGKLEARRHDADHGMRNTVDHQLLAEHVGAAAEALAPEAIAEDDHPRCADAVFVLVKVAADRRRNAERVEHRPRDVRALDVVRAVVLCEVERRPVVDADALECAVVGLPAPEVRVGHRVHVPSASRVRLAEGHELVGVLIWKGPEKRRADAAEDRGVYADAECEAEDSRDSERRILDQRADGEADVVEQARLTLGGRLMRWPERPNGLSGTPSADRAIRTIGVCRAASAAAP